MLGEFTGEEKTDGGLNLARGKSVAVVVASKTRSFSGNTLEDIVDERVHDGHGTVGDTSFGVNRLEDTVDVAGVSFMTLALSLLLFSLFSLFNLFLLGCGFSFSWLRHYTI